MAVQAGVLCGQGDAAVDLVLFCQSLLSLFLRDEIGHALEADADGGEVVQHGRRRRLQDAHCTCLLYTSPSPRDCS